MMRVRASSICSALRHRRDQARVVRQISGWLVEDQVSLYEIKRRSSAMGEPTKTGRLRGDRATVCYIVKNPAYAGQAAFGKTVAVPRGNSYAPRRSFRERQKGGWLAGALRRVR